MKIAGAIGVLAAAVLLSAGCATARRTYKGYSADQVWNALVEVAENPSYGDWKITANDVWADDVDRRIEIYRHLRRVTYSPESDPLREQRTWRFEIKIDETDPPRAVFTSRGFGMPADAQIEASRYFDGVDRILGAQVPQELMRRDEEDMLDALGLDEAPPPDDKSAEPPEGSPEDLDRP